jgi:phosphoglycerol transferase MdoB-like AlkP superfamily enzyme
MKKSKIFALLFLCSVLTSYIFRNVDSLTDAFIVLNSLTFIMTLIFLIIEHLQNRK